MPNWRLTVALLALVVLAACPRPEAPQTPPAVKQRGLAEKILRRAVRASTLSPEAREDLARAVGEVALPTHSARLRLIVAGEDPVLAKGAAKALAQIIHRREGEAGLRECVANETNDAVVAACKQAVSSATAAELNPGELARRLESTQLEERRGALRTLLESPKLPASGGSLGAALLHAFSDPDEQVAMMAAAVQLRRLIAEHEPELETALPQGQMQ
jgi:hypothetical protein